MRDLGKGVTPMGGGDPRRLRDLDAAPGSVEAEARALMRAADRHVPALGSKTRVRAALRERRGGAGALLLRPTLALLLVVATGAVATGTSLGRRWIDQGYGRLTAWTRTTAKPTTAKPASTAPASPAAPAVAIEPAPRADTPETTPTRRHEDRPAHRVSRPELALVEPVDDDDPQLVASAVHALRREHDAARASALLDTYVRRWPNGALVEEAMALAIEAAQAEEQAHPLRARALAQRYLQRFPSGRFVDTAHRALAGPTP